MKKLALATALTMVSVAQAASNSALYDLQYLPEAGTVFGSTSYSYYKYSNSYYDGTNDVTSRNNGHSLSQIIGYVPVQNLFLQAAASYADIKSKTTGESETKSTGFNDFTLTGRYRVLGGAQRFDLVGSFLFSPDDAVIESDEDMNNYSGGHTLNLGVEYGVKNEANQWSLGANFVRNFEATLDDKDTNDKTTDDAHNGLNFSAAMLTNFTEKFSIKNSLMVMFTEEYEDDDNGEVSASTNYLVEVKAQYLLSKDLMVVAGPRAVLGGSGYNFTYMIYDLGLNYQF
jgi:hypothetical protein